MSARQDLLGALIDAIHGPTPTPEARAAFEKYNLPKYERLTDVILSLRGTTDDAGNRVTWDAPAFDPEHDSEARCARERCGHTYYRHFDTHDDMAPVGCKYCHCTQFIEPAVPAINPTALAAEPSVRRARVSIHPDNRTTEEKTAHQFLHALWTKAVGTSNYDKDQWKNLEASLFRLSRGDAPQRGNPVCGNHWEGLTGRMVDGSSGCPWCHVATLQRQIQRLETDLVEARKPGDGA